MQVTHAGYTDPNNLYFDTITVLGLPNAPLSVSVTEVGTGSNPNVTSNLTSDNIQHDLVKEVNAHM